MLVAPLLLWLLLALGVGEVTSQRCDSARRYCRRYIRKRCKVAVETACKCSDYSSRDCASYYPRDRFQEEVQRQGQKCDPAACRLKTYWCSWSYWRTEFTNGTCAGTFTHQKRNRKRCCNIFRRRISFQCSDRDAQVQYERRREFEASDDGCEVPGDVGTPWYVKMGYGLAVSFGFAAVVKCVRGMFCRKPQQTPNEEDAPAPETEENFENARLDSAGDSGPPEALPLHPTAPLAPAAPPPSYDEVANCPDEFQPPPPFEKRF